MKKEESRDKLDFRFMKSGIPKWSRHLIEFEREEWNKTEIMWLKHWNCFFKKTHIKAMKWKKFFNSISGCIVKFGVEVSMQFKVLNEALKLYMKHKFIIWKHLRSFITSSSKIWMPFQIDVNKSKINSSAAKEQNH